VYLLIAWWVLPESPPVYGSTFWQFISQDIWPRSVQNGDWTAALLWYQHQLGQFALPALVDTVLLSQLALSLSAVLALITYPWASRQFLSSTPIAQTWRSVGKTVLLILRSTPEMILAFILLLLFGPSGLPAVIALAMHNGGLIAFLVARQSNELTLRADACRGVNRYVYEISPRIYPQLMALLFYRWEVILRESAILGILGVTTLGFYIDSAFEDIRYDRAFLLIVIAALLNIVVDSLARRLRRYCHLHAVPSM
jgi:phosphonate transport system permease protein